MLTKNKILYQCPTNEYVKKYHPFIHEICKDKKKNNGKTKNNPVVQPIVNNVKNKHATSKSNLEMARNQVHFQQKWTIQQPENKRNSTLRFTDLLENSKNMQGNHLGMGHSGFFHKNNQHMQLSPFQNSKKISHIHQPEDLHATTKMTRINAKIHNENSINRCIDPVSSVQYLKKSPMRIVNANRLNNTPKLIDLNAHHKNLESSINSKSIGKTKNSINLQCSQKISKFIEDSRKLDTRCDKMQKKNSYLSKNKSNLLSTGIINFSYPKEISNLCLDEKDSKNNLFACQFDIKTFCKEDPRQFQSFSSGKIKFNQEKLQSLLDRSNEMGNTLEKILKKRQKLQITSLISHHNNPQNINRSELSLKIQQLNQLKHQTTLKIQIFCQNIMKLSHLYTQNINSMILSLEQQKKNGIEWYQIDRQISNQDDFHNIKIKNQIIKERLSCCQMRLSEYDQDIDVAKDDNGLQQLKKEINLIENRLSRNEDLLNDLLKKEEEKPGKEKVKGKEMVLIQIHEIGKGQLQLMGIQIKRISNFLSELNSNVIC